MRNLSSVGLVALGFVLASTPGALQAGPTQKARVEGLGIYRMPFESLGLTAPVPSAGIGLTSHGVPVPSRVADGGDGELGPGDGIEFVGLPIVRTADVNVGPKVSVYLVAFDAEAPLRFQEGGKPPSERDTPKGGSVYRETLRKEEDTILVRFPRRPEEGDKDELWYWTKLTQLAEEPFLVPIDTPDLATGGKGAATLRVHFRGWSKAMRKPSVEMTDHDVAVSFNGKLVGRAQWMGDEPYLFESELPPGSLVAGPNKLEIRTEERLFADSGDSLVDVSLLNWVELSYPRSDRVRDAAARLELEGDAKVLSLTTAGEAAPRVFSDDGVEIGEGSMTHVKLPEGIRHTFRRPAGARSLVAASATAAPEVLPFSPGDLKEKNRADYILITHPFYAGKLRPLAAAHARRGLVVKTVTIEQIYDAFAEGYAEPKAIHDFISHAYHNWEKPAPRYVLLAGDASWDLTNAIVDDSNYAKWTFSTREEGEEGFGVMRGAMGRAKNERNMIPTWSHISLQGHSASDNFFACLEGDDVKPDIAIGRLPIAKRPEAEAIVGKLVRLIEHPDVGPWRRQALFINDGMSTYKKRSDDLMRSLGERGYSPTAIAPGEGADLTHHQETIRGALDKGQAIVHFLGHGGRFIWRTAEPDINAQKDLFTLDDLDKLVPSQRLPVVLSMTCYSAPFDHPSADSIGEKFLRIGDKGASAVLAASWRNAPAQDFSEALADEITKPGSTVGEAVAEAKRRTTSPDMRQLYNLLGDPAMPLPVPAHALAVTIARDGAAVTARTAMPVEGFKGRAIVEWVDGNQELLSTREVAMAGADLELRIEGAEAAKVAGARIYAWSEATQVDGIGYGALPGAEPVTTEAAGSPSR